MTLQFIIGMIASAINDRLQRKLDYLEEERRILREQLGAVTGIKKPSCAETGSAKIVLISSGLSRFARRGEA
jgi:hypothetical protein